MTKQSRQKRNRILGFVYTLLVLGAVAFIFLVSFGNKKAFSSTTEEPTKITEVMVLVGTEDREALTLPTTIQNLAPHTPVTLYAEIDRSLGDSLLVKTVFSPLRLYVDDILVYESGEDGSYPAYMNDPPTILSVVPLPDSTGTQRLRLEYLSPTQRSELSIPALSIGSESAFLARQIQKEGLSLLFALVLAIIGISMIVIFLITLRGVPAGESFLWLGLFSLAAGIWVFGECDLAAFLLPYPSLLYAMAYLGLFTVGIPFLQFGLVILNPKNNRSIKAMLYLNVASVLTAILLQLTAVMDFTKSLYWFHIILPLGFVVFAVNLVYEHIRYENSAAKRFAPAVILLALSTVLEVLNYWLKVTPTFTVFFQLGVLAFVIALGVVSGFYIQQSIQTSSDNLRLELEVVAMGHQLATQRAIYTQLTDNAEAVKAQRHDLRHQLAAIKGYNTSGEVAKLNEYLDELLAKIPKDNDYNFCENFAVNAVVAYYYDLAKNSGIEVSIKLNIPTDTGQVQSSDLSIVVGNLLENAVEACERMTAGKKFITLKSRLQHDVLTITMDNSFNGQYEKEDDTFLSGKPTGEGVGLSSVRAVAEKYGGVARFEVTSDTFLSSVYVKLN